MMTLHGTTCVSVATKSQSEVSHNFAAGDMVEVCEGELVHLQGRVIRIDGSKITMLPKHEDLKVSCRSLIEFLQFVSIYKFPLKVIAHIHEAKFCIQSHHLTW